MTEKNNIDPNFNPVHCTHCGRFLGYEQIIEGCVNLLCNKCKQWTLFEGTSKITLENNADQRYTKGKGK